MSNRLYLGRIPIFTKKKQILKAFEAFGPIHAVVLQAQTGNTGFVTFRTPEDAKRALEHTQRHPVVIRKRQISVMPADEWHHRPLPAAHNLRPSTSRERTPSPTNPFTGQKIPRLPELTEQAVAHISSYLPFSDRARMELVCRRWRDGVRLGMRGISKLPITDWKWSEDWGQLKIGKHPFHWALMHCGITLTEIIINRLNNLAGSNISMIPRYCPNLKILDITAVTIRPATIRALAAAEFPIQEFRIGECIGWVHPFLAEFLRNHDRTLRVFGARKTDLKNNTLGHIPIHLEEIDLDYNELDPEYLRIALARLSTVQVLTIRSPSDFTGGCIAALTDNEPLGRTLRSVTLSYCNTRAQYEEEPEEVQMERAAGLPFIEYELGPVDEARTLPQQFQHVQYLDVSHTGWIDSDFIAALGSHARRITTLDISGCTNVRGQFSLDPLRHLQQLTSLRMSLLHVSVGASFLRELKQLEELQCRDNRGVTDEDICGLIQSCRIVKTIDVEGCVEVGRPIIDCVQRVYRYEDRPTLSLFVGETTARAYRRDRQLIRLVIHYERVTPGPF